MLSSRTKEIMASCYTYGFKVVEFEKITYSTYVYTMLISRNSSNGMLTVTIRVTEGLHIVTHVFENMSDFRNIVL